jgi:predicted transposase/invertase (TIGR01784 family)
MDIEIQVSPFSHIGKRISYYKSKLIIEQIGEGGKYNTIERAICILITNYSLFKEANEYVNRFRFCNRDNGLIFEGIPEEIYTIELSKVPETSDGTPIYDWARFLKSKNKEEFEMVAKTNGEIRKAADKLYLLSADKEVRAEYERRQKALMDYDTHMEDHFLAGEAKGRLEGEAKGRLEGEAKGKLEGRLEERLRFAKTLLNEGFGIEKVSEMTSLDIESVKKL